MTNDRNYLADDARRRTDAGHAQDNVRPSAAGAPKRLRTFKMIN
jgi:hypothetical protein